MKIGFKQQGGAMPPYLSYTPYVPNTVPSTQVETQSSTQKSSSEDNNNIKDKDLLSMLKDIDGLPNDMQIIVNNLQNMYSLESLVPGQDSTQNLINLYLNSLYKTKVANFNKKQYDSAYNRVTENDGLSEFAITSSGQLVAQDKNTRELKLVSVQDYLSNKDKFSNDGKYALLTNSNLLYYRAHSPEYSFNNSIFSIVENGIGLEKVQEILKSNLINLGKTDKTIPFSAYQHNNKVLQGAEVLQQLASQGYSASTTLDGLYEGKIITESQLNQAKAAISYLYSTLPKNAQVLLQLRSGDAKNPVNGALELIKNLVLAGTSSSTQVSMDYKGNYNPDGTKADTQESKGGLDSVKYNVATQFLLGTGYSSVYTIQDGTKDGLQVFSTEMPVTKNKSPIGRSTLLDVTKSDFGGILDFQNASMGGLLLNSSGLSKVMTDGVLHSMDMVIDQDAYRRGIIRPDFKAFKRKEQADQYIKEHNITDKNQINQVYAQYKLPFMYDKNGRMNTFLYARFAVLNGNALNSAFSTQQPSDVTFNDYLRELSGTEEENAISEFKASDSKFKYDQKSVWDSISPVWNSHDSIYQGTIFIPVKNHVLNAMLSNNLTSKQINTLEALQQAQPRIQELQKKYVNGNSLKE